MIRKLLNLGFLAVVISLAVPVHASVTTEPVESVVQIIDWTSLTPELDPKVYGKYRAGKLSQSDLRVYMDSFYNTPRPELAGKEVSLTGYLLPQNVYEDGTSNRFILVKKISSWTHTDQKLKPNQVLLVEFKPGMKLNQTTRVRYRITGIMNVGKYSVPATETFYRLDASAIKVNRRKFNEKY